MNIKAYQIKSAIILFLSVILFSSCKEKGTITVSIIETTDIHGVIFPYDYIDMKHLMLPWLMCFIYQTERKTNDVVFLFDNGDNIMGSRRLLYNYIDTVSPHLMSEAFNYLEYDAVTAGNHDIESRTFCI
jgi:2',3'-cyclic-nucleotide 2'-phosphodiesterase/3'-nucleotidase